MLDHPAVLCDQRAHGELDLALVSSFEFLRNPIYQIINDISISSAGPVYSVFVAYAGEMPWPDIELDQASQTSVALLRYSVSERGYAFRSLAAPADMLSPLEPGRARLLIGDQAIRFRQKFAEAYRYWDLGEEWQGLTKLPFVYALWLVRPEVTNANTIADRLRALRGENLANIENLIAEEKEFDPEFTRRYYHDYLHFEFGEKEKQGLHLFQSLCEAHGLIPPRRIEFNYI